MSGEKRTAGHRTIYTYTKLLLYTQYTMTEVTDAKLRKRNLVPKNMFWVLATHVTLAATLA